MTTENYIDWDWGDVNKMHEETKCKNEKILSKFDSQISKEILQILEAHETCLSQQYFKIVDDKIGRKASTKEFCEFEDYKFKKIKFVWINQTTNGGYNGDDFCGDIYIPVLDGKFLKIYYSI